MEFFDKIFVTNLPSFYKINLYNEISKKIKVLVVFTGDAGDDRNSDFFTGRMNFDYVCYKSKNIFYRIFFTIYLLTKYRFRELIIGGWDSLPMWLFALLSSSKKNSVVVESSYFESATCGIKGLLKRGFLLNILNKAYVSGESQSLLVRKLGFKGVIIKTKGVGVFNYIKQPQFICKKEVKSFIFVGRLVEVKNLEFLISVFNKLPHLTLKIVGFGKLEYKLKSIAANNVLFYGAVKNLDLRRFYQDSDVFILPSKSEPWGLVVEEALNNGLPVIISDRVGCGPEIIDESNGMIFRYNSESDLIKKINIMTNVEYYNKLRENISKLDFEKIERNQVDCYL